MKSGRSGFCVLFLCMLFLLFCPVHADETFLTVTDVFFTKDGLPYDESVRFTMNCYGWSRYSDPALYPGTGNYTPELVFSFYASCPRYGCRIYENYYHADWNIIEYCNLEGNTRGKTFRIRNFSKTPTPRCRWLGEFSFSNRPGEYYNTIPEYEQCTLAMRSERKQALQACKKYPELVPCNLSSDPRCRLDYFANKSPFMGNPDPAAGKCEWEINQKYQGKCDQYLEKLDPANLTMWKDDNGDELAAQRACRLRFAIPSGSGNSTVVSPSTLSPVIPTVPGLHMPMITNSGPVPAAVRQSPVESLFCNILQYLGGKCQ